MNFSRFFIDRPIFAGVLSTLIFVAGLLSLPALPISEYPEVAPPTVVVRAQYPGANPKVIAETVSTPIEEQINGVEGMLYMSSQATTDGLMTLNVTFRLGTDPDKAQQLVQNRVAQAEPRLPSEVRTLGITTIKSAPDLTMVVHLLSPNGRYDMTYLRNYAVLNVKDRLARIEGVGQVQLFGSGDYSMRVWLDPQKVAERGLSASDVVREIRAQNVQAAAGVVGASPSEVGLDLQLSINAQGRLQTEEEFGEIIVKNGANGEVTRLRDIARIELGAADYSLRSLLDNKSAVAVPIFQSPGSNAIQISDTVRKMMVELKANMPDGMDYSIVYDPTQFVRASIEAVVHTLLEAVALVVLVVILFLQTWRASIIPLIAVPVSIIGTFAVMHVFGFSINALTLFGLVLAIGIVVDDAIVVVENVERNIEQGLTPKEAAYQAMQEVTGPIIAIALVLIAVFVPLAFITGLTGQFYKQFALTVAISTVISAFNSLTLSPALAAVLLKSHDAPKDALTRGMDRVLGWFFQRFNRFFHRSSEAYGHGVKRVISRRAIVMVGYVALIGVTFGLFKAVPGGFVPGQDKQYLVGFAQLPDGATLDRTEEVIRRMGDIALKLPGVESAVAFPGLSINGFTNSSNSGIVFVTLKPFEERKAANLSAGAIAGQLNGKFSAIQEAFIAMFPPPPVAGLGTIGGFKLQIEDRAGLGYEALNDATKAFIAKASGGATTGRAVLQLSGQRAAALCRYRPHPGAAAQRARDQRVRYHADLSRLALRQRLQQVRPHLFGAGTGGREIPRPRRRCRAVEGALRHRRDGAAVGAAEDQGKRRAGARHALQRLPHRRPQWRCGARLFDRAGPGRGGEDRGRDLSEGHRVRVDRPDVSGNHCRQFVAGGVSGGAAAGIPGARRAIREPDPAAVDHHDRADGIAGGDARRLADQGRQQRVHPDRIDRSGGTVGQECHPDRGVRARAGIRRTYAGAGRDRSQPLAAAADPDDLACLHHGRGAAGDLQRRRLRDASCHGGCGVFRHDRRHGVRHLLHADVLRAAARIGR